MAFSLRCAHCGQYLPEGHVQIDRDGRTELTIRHICSAKAANERQEPSSITVPVERSSAS